MKYVTNANKLLNLENKVPRQLFEARKVTVTNAKKNSMELCYPLRSVMKTTKLCFFSLLTHKRRELKCLPQNPTVHLKSFSRQT